MTMTLHDWTYKGVRIWMDNSDGRFRFRNKAGQAVVKNSLKSAQNAIDREAGTPVVVAMDNEGKPIKIAKRDQRRERSRYGATTTYYDPNGREVRAWGGIFNWDQDVAKKLVKNHRLEREEVERHNRVDGALRKERDELTNQAGRFDYDAAVAAANQKDENNDGNDN